MTNQKYNEKHSITFFLLWVAPMQIISLFLRIFKDELFYQHKLCTLILFSLFVKHYAFPMIVMAFHYAKAAASKPLTIVFGAMTAIHLIWMILVPFFIVLGLY